MTKILLINQHSSNHGDEAAARALTAKLSKLNADFSILYNASGDHFQLDLPLDFQEVRNTRKITNIEKTQIMASLNVPFKALHGFFSKDVRAEYDMLCRADYVISMPGGANLGLYEDWRYLWRLMMAQRLGKKTAIYSTSIGPFRDNRFKKLTFDVLNKADWLSLRDAASIQYGRSSGIDLEESIDTAFLVQDFAKTSWQGKKLADFGVMFAPDSYCVFVPNNLKTGHKTFLNVPKKHLDELYLALLNKSLAAGMNVVMLPQLFGNGNDRDYFNELAKKSNDPSRIFVAAENILSDHQQLIISKARFVVGARYHSVIFSINMRTPFLCLSYENKMRFTLERLRRPEMVIDMTELSQGGSHEKMIGIGTAYIDSLAKSEISPADSDKALTIARTTYDNFQNRFLPELST
jgi:colanic acid/amylovoran biosynthesis protein